MYKFWTINFLQYLDIDIIRHIKQIYIDKTFNLIRPPTIDILYKGDKIDVNGLEFTSNGLILSHYSYYECRVDNWGNNLYKITYCYRIPGYIGSISATVKGNLEPFLNYHIQYICDHKLYETNSIKEQRYYYIKGDGLLILTI